MAEQNSNSGVQDLIDRLSEEGVAEGQKKADSLVTDAHRKSDQLLEDARRQAEEIVSKARAEADAFQKASQEALKLASRDSVRNLAEQIHGRFREWLQRMVHQELANPDVLKEMILTVTGAASPDQDKSLGILVPDTIATTEELKDQIASGDVDALMQFVRGLVGSSIREGVEFETGEGGQVGIRVRVVEDDVEIDLTEEALMEVLLSHMLPRFRASLMND